MNTNGWKSGSKARTQAGLEEASENQRNDGKLGSQSLRQNYLQNRQRSHDLRHSTPNQWVASSTLRRFLLVNYLLPLLWKEQPGLHLGSHISPSQTHGQIRPTPVPLPRASSGHVIQTCPIIEVHHLIPGLGMDLRCKTDPWEMLETWLKPPWGWVRRCWEPPHQPTGRASLKRRPQQRETGDGSRFLDIEPVVSEARATSELFRSSKSQEIPLLLMQSGLSGHGHTERPN